jgi:hypothetical protein
MAVENVWTGQKIWRHKWPWRDNSYQKQGQYLFGTGNSNWHIVQSFSGQKTQNRQQQTTEVYIL